jgi:hypothetical protein
MRNSIRQMIVSAKQSDNMQVRSVKKLLSELCDGWQEE